MTNENEARKREIRLSHINQMLAEIDKEIRSRFGDIVANPVHKARIARFKKCCRGELSIEEIPEDERENVRRLRQEWIDLGRNEVWMLMQSRFLLLSEGIHQRNEDDPEGEWLEREAMISYIESVERKYRDLIRQADGEVMAEETPKMKREREKAKVFAMMDDVLNGMAARNESAASRAVWRVSMRHLFKNARTLCSRYNTWNNARRKAASAHVHGRMN